MQKACILLGISATDRSNPRDANMENRKLSMIATVVVVFMGAIPSARPEAANEFQSNGTKCNWNDGSLWSLGHPLKKSEQPVFKADGSVVEIDDEIPISCNVYIGAKNLTMQGKGVLDLVNPALARSSIYIPSDGFSCANLTVRGNLSINARITTMPPCTSPISHAIPRQTGAESPKSTSRAAMS
jgi:hypothetical protein